jgi:hypothetical protein
VAEKREVNKELKDERRARFALAKQLDAIREQSGKVPLELLAKLDPELLCRIIKSKTDTGETAAIREMHRRLDQPIKKENRAQIEARGLAALEFVRHLPKAHRHYQGVVKCAYQANINSLDNLFTLIQLIPEKDKTRGFILGRIDELERRKNATKKREQRAEAPQESTTA